MTLTVAQVPLWRKSSLTAGANLNFSHTLPVKGDLCNEIEVINLVRYAKNTKHKYVAAQTQAAYSR